MEKISCCVLAYNDAERIAKFIDAVRPPHEMIPGVDEVIVSLDEFSTDKTGEIAEKLGAKVVKRSDHWKIPTLEDINRFEDRFKFKPHFDTTNKFCHSGDVRNEAMTYAKNDWILFLDSDEIITWDLSKVEQLMKDADQIRCKYIHARDTNGNPNYTFEVGKLFKRSKHIWKGRVHEVATATQPIKVAYTEDATINHYHQHRIVDPKKASRGMQAMEYAVIKDYDARTTHYLAREYYYNRDYVHAIQLYLEYLKVAKWLPEIVEAHLKLSRCYWELQKGNESRIEILEAIKQDPMNKEAVFLASVYFSEPWSSKWKKLSQACDNSDALFKPEI